MSHYQYLMLWPCHRPPGSSQASLLALSPGNIQENSDWSSPKSVTFDVVERGPAASLRVLVSRQQLETEIKGQAEKSDPGGFPDPTEELSKMHPSASIRQAMAVSTLGDHFYPSLHDLERHQGGDRGIMFTAVTVTQNLLMNFVF